MHGGTRGARLRVYTCVYGHLNNTIETFDNRGTAKIIHNVTAKYSGVRGAHSAALFTGTSLFAPN